MSYNSNSVAASILQSIAFSAWHVACILHNATINKGLDMSLLIGLGILNIIFAIVALVWLEVLS